MEENGEAKRDNSNNKCISNKTHKYIHEEQSETKITEKTNENKQH